jgi:hypothetical protein
VKATGWLRGLEVAAGGTGIVSHAGLALLRALRTNVELTAGLSKALASRRLLVHDRGQVVADLACAIADGAEVISDFRVMADQRELFGLVEFGKTRFQELADAFVGGKPVDDRVLPRVWQQAGRPGRAFTSPIYREFFHTVRAINASRPAGQRTRVLLGDPPIGTCAAALPTPGRFGIRAMPTAPR